MVAAPGAAVQCARCDRRQLLGLWGGLYGIVYAIVAPRLHLPGWLCGLLLGVLAVVVLVFVVGPIKHFSPLTSWATHTWIRILLIHLFWGLGVAALFSLFTGFRPLRKV
jgi:hypothetical protein